MPTPCVVPRLLNFARDDLSQLMEAAQTVASFPCAPNRSDSPHRMRLCPACVNSAASIVIIEHSPMELVMSNPNQRLQDAGQSLWIDNITRTMLRDGTLTDYRDRLAVSGLTSNPSIFEKAIENSDDYNDDIRDSSSREAEQVFFDLAVADLRRAAAVFAPIHARTNGVDGWVSLEVSPLLADDAKATIEQAIALHQRAAVENLFIKVPGTSAGVEAIEELVWRGVPVNVTLLFSADQYQCAAEAWMRGLERRLADGLDLDVASVASLFISRWDVKVAKNVPRSLRNRLGLAVAADAYARYRELLDSRRVQRLMNAGARPQRLLWASTSTKDPDASDVLYVENLIAPLTINTMPGETLQSFADHGQVKSVMPRDDDAVRTLLEQFAEHDQHVGKLAQALQVEGAAAFADSWNSLLGTLKKRMESPA